MVIRTAVLIPVLLALTACMSAEKRYEQAGEDEAQGRWDAAAAKYIDVLRRDPGYPGAREKLEEVGNRAIQEHVDTANGLESAGRYERATQEYGTIDQLLERAAGVRVVLRTPPDYVSMRRRTFDRAIEQALVAADRLAGDGRWQEAVEAYRRAETRHEPTEVQRRRAREGRFRALLGGAKVELVRGQYEGADAMVVEALEIHGPDSPQSRPAVALREQIQLKRYRTLVTEARDHMGAGRYQQAFAAVERALTVYGPEVAASAEARELRDLVIEQGTVLVAVTPLWRREKIGRLVPAGLLEDINDILADEHWTEPPLFVAVADPRAVRQTLRRLEFDREVLSGPRAATVAQRVGAGFVAVPFLVRCDYDAEEQPEKRIVKRRDGGQAEILVYRKRTLFVRCAYRIVNVHDGRVVAEGHLDTSDGRRRRHAVYAGDSRELLLTAEEHGWFDRRRLRDADREIERAVARALAGGLAEAVYGDVIRHLP
jgi:tetratricopeptide (TPR) repeat protein